MTEKLYLKEPYKKTLKAKVIKTLDEPSKIVLDKTIFYPEGGGQPADSGSINGFEIKDVQIINSEIVHIIDGEIDEGTEVECKLDWKKRHLLMQQHTGQHILSRVLEVNYDADTVGFHISDDYVTIDIDKKVTDDALEKVEKQSNEIIYNNLEVMDYYVDHDKIEELPIRNKPKVDSNIRIVEIDNFDYCPCGGTHLNTTSEVGIIKIKKATNHKNGRRIEFVCGKMALMDYKWKNSYINNISDLLSIKDIDVETRVKDIFEENIEMSKEIKKLKEQISELEVNQMINEKINLGDFDLIKKVYENEDFKKIRNIASNLVQNNKNLMVIFLNNKENSSNFLIGKSNDVDYDIRKLFNDNIDKLNGNGGGNDYLLQGGGQSAKNPHEFLTNIYKALK